MRARPRLAQREPGGRTQQRVDLVRAGAPPRLDRAALVQRPRQAGEPREPAGDLDRREPSRPVAAQLDRPAAREPPGRGIRQAARGAPHAVASDVEPPACQGLRRRAEAVDDPRGRDEQRVVAGQHGAEGEVDVLVVEKEALRVAAERVEDVAAEDRRRARRGEDRVRARGQVAERAVAQELVGIAVGRVLIARALDPARRGAHQDAPERPRALVARRRGELREPVGRRRRVGVQDADPGRRRRGHATVRAAREAEVAPELQHADAGMSGAQERHRPVVRAVVGDDDLRGRERLRRQRAEALRQQPLAVVVDDDDRDAAGAHGAVPPAAGSKRAMNASTSGSDSSATCSLTFSVGQSHHLIRSSAATCSSVKRRRTSRAGLPTTIA